MAELPQIDFAADTSAGSLDEKELLDTEDLLGDPLDPNHVEFLRRHNGGVPVQRYFSLGDNVKVIDRFLCIVPRTRENELHAQYHVGVVWSQIVDRAPTQVPFAVTFGGDFLCYDYAQGEPLPVVFWDHEKSRADKPHLTPVASSFVDFLELLRAEPPKR